MKLYSNAQSNTEIKNLAAHKLIETVKYLNATKISSTESLRTLIYYTANVNMVNDSIKIELS